MINYDVIQSTRVILHQGSVRCYFLVLVKTAETKSDMQKNVFYARYNFYYMAKSNSVESIKLTFKILNQVCYMLIVSLVISKCVKFNTRQVLQTDGHTHLSITPYCNSGD